METFLPPGEMVFLHNIPVISRKSPVLPIDRKVIGRSSCLAVHIEILWFCPGIDTGTIHSDREVAFQDNAILTGIVGYRLELSM